MSASVRVQIDGIKELRDKFTDLDAAAKRRVLRTALRKAGNVVRAEARQRAPVRTGGLKRGIMVQTKFAEGEGAAVIGFTKRRFYGVYHERGTKKMRERPILRPALDAKREDALAAFREALTEETNRLTRG